MIANTPPVISSRLATVRDPSSAQVPHVHDLNTRFHSTITALRSRHCCVSIIATTVTPRILFSYPRYWECSQGDSSKVLSFAPRGTAPSRCPRQASWTTPACLRRSAPPQPHRVPCGPPHRRESTQRKEFACKASLLRWILGCLIMSASA